MTEKSHPIKLALTDPGESGKIVVDMEAFFDFSFWIAEELEDLVAQWNHVAVPTSRRVERELRSGDLPTTR